MFSLLVKRITEYIKLKTQQIKLQLVGHMARLMSRVLVFGLLAFLLLFIVLFLSLGAGAWLNEILDSNYFGFLIISGIYLLVFILIALLAKSGKIQSWIEGAILRASEQIDEEDE